MLWMIDNPVAGPFILSLITSVVVLLMLPYSIVAIATGYTFQYAYKEIVTVLGIGTAVIFFGAYLGALISFPIGRRICRVRVKAYASKKPVLRALESILEKDGLKLILLLRLSIAFPFNFSNYFMGASSVKFSHFALGTFSLIPITTFYVYIGTTL